MVSWDYLNHVEAGDFCGVFFVCFFKLGGRQTDRTSVGRGALWEMVYKPSREGDYRVESVNYLNPKMEVAVEWVVGL